jgi:hypothetical protein
MTRTSGVKVLWTRKYLGRIARTGKSGKGGTGMPQKTVGI